MSLSTHRRAALARIAAASLPGLFATAATAADGKFPERPITLVVPNAAGGAADNLARAFAEELAGRLGQPVVVENVGGASGALGALRVLRAAPDGHTLLFGTTSDMVVTPIANRSAGYAPRDFTPIAKVGITQMLLVARPGLGVASVDQLVALARQKPDGLSVGITGNASLQAFAAVAMQRAAAIDLMGVPYKGGAPLLNDLLGGQVDLAILALPGALPHVRAGKLVALGLLSDKRAAAALDIPAVNESSAVKGVQIEIWAALAGPPKLPAAVVDALARATATLLGDKAFVERRAKVGDQTPPVETPAEFARFLAAEEQRFRTLATGMKLE
jgi:tripartite-type tricarboxylate transporter receptor subunit TctC